MSGLKVDARPIIESAEVFPKQLRQRDLRFDILRSELSKRPNEVPRKKFTVRLDLLHQLAKYVFLQDTSSNEDYETDRHDYPAMENTQTTPNSSLTTYFGRFSEVLHSDDPSLCAIVTCKREAVWKIIDCLVGTATLSHVRGRGCPCLQVKKGFLVWI